MKSPSKPNQIKSKKRVKDFGEVYTNEREVKAMLDLVKEESYQIDSLFLEPACGNGNFLVEILKRKLSVSKTKEEVLIALSSIYAIDILEDNVLESKKRLYELVQDNLTQEEAFFMMDQNIVCGDSLELLNTPFYTGMKFDVIIGNPPYQLSDGGYGASAMPLYHKFVQQAKNLNPKYITMIIPSRWFSGGRGLDAFRFEMLNDRRIEKLVDFPDSKSCFPSNDIKGGICYFLWNSHYDGDCTITYCDKEKTSTLKRPLLEDGQDIFIRYNEAIPILHKVTAKKERSFSDIVSGGKPFGFRTFFKGRPIQEDGDVKLYGNKSITYLSKNQIEKNIQYVNEYKLFTPYAVGSGNIETDWVKPIKGYPNEICTETYVMFGPFSSETEMNNAYLYTQTKFFHFMLGLKKISQHTTAKFYELVPLQDFSKPWTDSELYEKYGLTLEEIDYIESMIRPMN